MPNWCDNRATVTFRSCKKADEFVEACKEVPSAPVPGTLFDMTKPMNLFEYYHPEPDGIGDGWYAWRNSNWGTKWPIDIAEVLRLGDCTVQLQFQSAWGPPTEWFEYCGEVHGWKWELTYIETGMGFAGTASNCDGGVLKERFTDADPEYLDIAEEFGISFEDYDDDSQSTP